MELVEIHVIDIHYIYIFNDHLTQTFPFLSILAYKVVLEQKYKEQVKNM